MREYTGLLYDNPFLSSVKSRRASGLSGAHSPHRSCYLNPHTLAKWMRQCRGANTCLVSIFSIYHTAAPVKYQRNGSGTVRELNFAPLDVGAVYTLRGVKLCPFLHLNEVIPQRGKGSIIRLPKSPLFGRYLEFSFHMTCLFSYLRRVVERRNEAPTKISYYI